MRNSGRRIQSADKMYGMGIRKVEIQDAEFKILNTIAGFGYGTRNKCCGI